MAEAVDSTRRPPDRGTRVLIYSHDTFGLGHLRRSMAIANALVRERSDVSVVILSGSPVAGSFEFGEGVDYIRIPGVTKLPDGDYRSLNLNLSLDEAVGLRAAIIRQTAETFAPDLLIVDKEPTGFRGELIPALDTLRAGGCRIVLGVRDVLDDPDLLVPEWDRKGAAEILDRYYDEVWVYGLRDFYEPLRSLRLTPRLDRKTIYTGYLRRDLPLQSVLSRYPKITRQPFILVTAGGGGDGEDVIDWAISAYEADPDIPCPALVVFGPFVGRESRRGFLERIARHPKIDAISFDTKLELLIRRASGVVAMGGYNTFCEILSFDKRSLIVPRSRPRREQLIRAVAAERAGLVRALVEGDDGSRDPARMAAALRALPDQKLPSEAAISGLLGGLEAIRGRFATLHPAAAALQAAE